MRNIRVRMGMPATTLCAVFGMQPILATAGDVTVGADPDTGLKSWKFAGDGLDIDLVQVPPDFIRASY